MKTKTNWQSWADLISQDEYEMAANAAGLTLDAGKELNPEALQRFNQICDKLREEKINQ